jgi:hypothetical protein
MRSVCQTNVLYLFYMREKPWLIWDSNPGLLGIKSAMLPTEPLRLPMKARELKFWFPQYFGPPWCTSYSEFWNLESLGYLPYKFRLCDRRTVQKFGCASQKNKKLVIVNRFPICDKSSGFFRLFWRKILTNIIKLAFLIARRS